MFFQLFHLLCFRLIPSIKLMARCPVLLRIKLIQRRLKERPLRNAGACSQPTCPRMAIITVTRTTAKIDRVFKCFLLAGEIMGAAGLSTGARTSTAVNPVITARADITSPEMELKCDKKVASSARAGNIIIVIIAQRQGELECAPPAVCLNRNTVARQAAVTGRTPNSKPRSRVKSTLIRLITSTSIA